MTRRRRSSGVLWRLQALMPRDRWEDLAEMLALTVLSFVLLAEAMVVAAGLGAR